MTSVTLTIVSETAHPTQDAVGFSHVVVVSPHTVVRTGVEALLAATRSLVVRGVTSGSDDRFRCDVVIYDLIGLERGSTVELDALVHRPDIAVLALTRPHVPLLTTLALDHGADGCVTLGVSSGGLLDAVLGVLAAPRNTGRNPQRRGRTALASDGTRPLSPRDLDVLRLVGSGHTNAEIAVTLFVSIDTVKTHIRHAYRSIGVTRRSQAVLWAHQVILGSPGPIVP